MPPNVRFVGAVHDSLLFEMESSASRYHWIEEGTFEDFKRNILESDLPVFTFDFASTGYALMGTYTGRMAANPCAEVPLEVRLPEFQQVGEYALMGTHVAVDIWVDLAKPNTEQSVVAMLMARPEMKHEPQAAKA